ncbi:MAG: carbamoyl phosphate synthase small subunit, partial [Alistipes sp.]|nr:carbamoyl phosphate synthase small subunit [Alistipes sp.]
KNLATGLLEVASQNHGYVVQPELPGMLKVTHTNLLDQTIEGLECKLDRLFAVQFEPASAESEYHDVFKKFVKLMEEGRDA